MSLNPLEQRVTETIEPSLEAMGYELVLVKMQDGAKRRTLTIMADRKDGKMMSFDDCAEISTQASALLDVEDFIQGAYNLEVSSPGIDRPLTKPEAFARYLGHEAKIETQLPVEGRKRFRGPLKATTDKDVTITVDKDEFTLPFSNIRTAKLVMTDALLKEAMKKSGS